MIVSTWKNVNLLLIRALWWDTAPVPTPLIKMQIGATFLADIVAINVQSFKMCLSFDPWFCSLEFFLKNMNKDVFHLLIIKIISSKQQRQKLWPTCLGSWLWSPHVIRCSTPRPRVSYKQLLSSEYSELLVCLP